MKHKHDFKETKKSAMHTVILCKCGKRSIKGKLTPNGAFGKPNSLTQS